MSKWVVVATLIFAVGAHWTLLQSVAWVGMAVSYSQNGSFKDALEKTFDGKHPCKLCQLVAAGKKSEKQQAAQTLVTKIDFALSACSVAVYPLVLEELPVYSSGLPHLRLEAPPLPPPRELPG